MSQDNHSETPAELKDVAGHPFLRGLSPKHLDALALCAMSVHFPAGHVILREGDPANRFYLIKSGGVAIEAERDEKHISLQVIRDGSILGWSWLFPPFFNHFDARAVEPTEAMFFYGTRLREMCEQDHDLGYEIHRRISAVVVDRLISAEQKLIEKTHA